MFNLSCNDFDKVSSNTLKELLGQTDFADVTLVSGDLKQIRAHKVILLSPSSFLKNKLENNGVYC